MKNDIKYLLNIIKNFGLLDPPPKDLCPTFYHTNSYKDDLEMYNKLKEIEERYIDCSFNVTPTILKQCICICEPRGDYGLEGFQLNNTYSYYRLNSKYYRIYPDESNGYYELCTTQTFNKYFKMID